MVFRSLCFKSLGLYMNYMTLFPGMSVFLKNISFHGILLDALFDSCKMWETVADLVSNGIKSGAVRPLRTTVFDHNQIEDAFRFMAQGKHIGKVVIQVCRIFSLISLT